MQLPCRVVVDVGEVREGRSTCPYRCVVGAVEKTMQLMELEDSTRGKWAKRGREKESQRNENTQKQAAKKNRTESRCAPGFQVFEGVVFGRSAQ
jgi:hypothetical protein